MVSGLFPWLIWRTDWPDVGCVVKAKDGYLVPSNAPGFGFEIDEDWLEQVTV